MMLVKLESNKGGRLFASALRAVALALIGALVWTPALLAWSADETVSMGGPQTLRRLTENEYKRSIAQIFGPKIAVPGRFEPPVREDGLLAIGSSQVVVTPSGFEQDMVRAREISAEVLSEQNRAQVLSCPSTSPVFDATCTTQFLSKYGRLLFRRPLTDSELESQIGVVRHATEASGSFNKGLESGLSGLLISPSFLFRIETTVADPAGGGEHLDDYSLASRISFLLWDAPPDEQLLDAAGNGGLRSNAGILGQVDRMMASSQFEQGARAFFFDMFAYDQFDGLSRDPALFPIFNPRLRNDAEEQSLRTVIDHLITERKDYRNLFTTKKTYLSRSLGALYGVPVSYEAFDGWMPYTFGPNDPYAGLLTLPAFLMLDPSHEGRTSPTIRGKSLRTQLLCQNVPPPPGNVNQAIAQDTSNPLYKTARDRLKAHQSNPVCAGCHAITDPTGLAMENYTAVGQWRAQENGAPIDASGTFEGKPFRNFLEFEEIVARSPALPNCLVQRVYEYGVGRKIAVGERDWVKSLDQRFADEGFRFPTLVRDIAGSAAFRTVSSDGATVNKVASN